jgi:NRPS condensation-like uncharacterized protein
MSSSKKDKLKVESFDILQYFYRKVNDPIIHGLFHFSGQLDEAALKNAVTLSEKAIPVIGCCYTMRSGRPRWKNQSFTGENIVKVVKAGEGDKSLPKTLLASTIDITKEPQLKIFIVRYKEKDTLCVLMNHMVCDGVGFKQYLYLLSKLYTNIKTENKAEIDLTYYSRGTGQLFSKFSFFEKLGILFSKYDLSFQKKQAIYRLNGDESNPFFETLEINSEDLNKIKAYAKSRGATLNDAILAAYARILSEKTGERQIVIPCPVDLRKYLPQNNKHTFCNLVSNFICNVEVKEGSAFEETLKLVSEQMKRQKQSDSCLKSIIMLEAAFKFLPFSLLQAKFDKVFTIPVLSYTNIGIIDDEKFRFANLEITDAFITSAIKHVPYFQIAVTSFKNRLTMSCNLHGTQQDKEQIEDFLKCIYALLLGQANARI